MTKQTTQTEIQSASVARGVDKLTHEVFYVVKSDSSENTWYTVRWDQAACEWRCNCPARKPCKHERAVNEVLKTRRACIAAQIGGDTPAIVARMQAAEDRKQSERAQPAASEPVKGNLNGERGFSLYR